MLGAYIIRRLLLLPLTLLGVYTVVFIFLYSLPGSPAVMVTGIYSSHESIEQARKVLGLDQPLHVQYLRYLGNIAQGSLGNSFHTRQPVLADLMSTLPATLELTFAAVLLSVLMGVPAGIISAIKRDSAFDHFLRLFTVFGWAMPSFWLGLILILVFALYLDLLPTSGRGGLDHLILPALTLALGTMASIARLTRSSLLEVLDEHYVVTARAKGLAEKRVIVVHALKNAFLPIITVIGYQLGALLTAAILVETVFAWPGVGRLLVTAIQQRDFPIVQGTVIVMGSLFLLINLVVDVSYTFLDPRIRYS